MSTMTEQKVNVSVNLMEKSVTYMSNTLFQIKFKIAQGRGLSPDYLVQNREILENGFFAWLSEQTLLSVHFEVIAPDGSKALERWDLSFDYRADPDETVEKPPVQQIEEACRKLRSLPPGTNYRILVETKPEASEVQGWHETEFLPFAEKSNQEFSNWGYGHIFGKLWYREGTW